jgi:hypothetical protein
MQQEDGRAETTCEPFSVAALQPGGSSGTIPLCWQGGHRLAMLTRGNRSGSAVISRPAVVRPELFV